jgi:hypothetical protein
VHQHRENILRAHETAVEEREAGQGHKEHQHASR